jgi:hypothetical protein
MIAYIRTKSQPHLHTSGLLLLGLLVSLGLLKSPGGKFFPWLPSLVFKSYPVQLALAGIFSLFKGGSSAEQPQVDNVPPPPQAVAAAAGLNNGGREERRRMDLFSEEEEEGAQWEDMDEKIFQEEDIVEEVNE